MYREKAASLYAFIYFVNYIAHCHTRFYFYHYHDYYYKATSVVIVVAYECLSTLVALSSSSLNSLFKFGADLLHARTLLPTPLGGIAMYDFNQAVAEGVFEYEEDRLQI